MCLAVPGRIESVYDKMGTRMGEMDFAGIRKEVCLALLPEVDVGDWAIVHVGFAISQVDEATAAQTLDHIRELGRLAEELGEEGRGEGAKT